MWEPKFVLGNSYKCRYAKKWGYRAVAASYCHDDPFILCRLETVLVDSRIVRAYGLARRSVLDKPNRVIGEQRAYGRAAIELVRAIKENDETT